MGQRRPERQLVDARNRYLGAVRRFDHALQAFDNSGMAMDPGPGPEPIPWTPEQRRIIAALPAVIREVVDARDSWDALRAELRAPH